jgi:hypothetical protein
MGPRRQPRFSTPEQATGGPQHAASAQVEQMRRDEAERLGLDPNTATWDEIRAAQEAYMLRLKAQLGA